MELTNEMRANAQIRVEVLSAPTFGELKQLVIDLYAEEGKVIVRVALKKPKSPATDYTAEITYMEYPQ